MPVDDALAEVYLLYAAVGPGEAPAAPASGTSAEIVRVMVTYADGSQVEVPLLVGRHVLEWSFDRPWQTSAALNDNNAYLAWEGLGGHGESVRLYYLRWVNEQPANRIRSSGLSNAQSTAGKAFRPSKGLTYDG